MAALALGAVFPAAAERADRDKPMNAEADALRYDDLKQTSVFTGNVVITKGTTIVRGAGWMWRKTPRATNWRLPQGHPASSPTTAKSDGVDEYIEGEGERIEYDSRADLVKFIKSAVVRRYNGATLLDETTGALIVYDNNTDVFTVDGGAQNRTATNPTGRVRAMLAPRTAASAPGTPPAAVPPVVLRPSTTLGTDKK
ncbi:lipopolysaccharide transport periplasmic protein LptA [Polaromonas sp. P1(28)-13]|nr:lipopolysaccharide transport periplasmic protein LptA [Polaromonas sp. P1(28)-13]